MSQKKPRVKISLPSRQTDMFLMSAVKNGGKKDRAFLRSVCSAHAEFDRHRNDSAKKFNKDLSPDE